MFVCFDFLYNNIFAQILNFSCIRKSLKQIYQFGQEDLKDVFLKNHFKILFGKHKKETF